MYLKKIRYTFVNHKITANWLDSIEDFSFLKSTLAFDKFLSGITFYFTFHIDLINKI